MNVHDRVQLIVFAREKDLGLYLIDKTFVLIQAGGELISDIFAFPG
jgi:hypothetical protein